MEYIIWSNLTVDWELGVHVLKMNKIYKDQRKTNEDS